MEPGMEQLEIVEPGGKPTNELTDNQIANQLKKIFKSVIKDEQNIVFSLVDEGDEVQDIDYIANEVEDKIRDMVLQRSGGIPRDRCNKVYDFIEDYRGKIRRLAWEVARERNRWGKEGDHENDDRKGDEK